MNQENIKKFGRIQSIDYLKAFAIVLVILTHALTKTQRLKIAGPFWISMAVPIFMIISGFTNTLTAEKEGFDQLKNFFAKKEFVHQISKILKPYLFIVLIEYFVGIYQLIILSKGPFVGFLLKDYFLYFLTGGTTPGSYYIPILFQLILIFPLMFILFKKSPKVSIAFFTLLHFTF